MFFTPALQKMSVGCFFFLFFFNIPTPYAIDCNTLISVKNQTGKCSE